MKILPTHRLRWICASTVVLSLGSVTVASANHLAVGSRTLGAGKANVTSCMTGSDMTFTYYLDSSGNVSTVVVGNIASACGGGSLKAELAGSPSPLPEGLGPVTVSASSPCSQPGGAGTVYSCSMTVTGTVAPGNVTHNYAAITGP